ncbi:MAG: M1 family aminopeptidase [Blastocatellia bacterium]|nr:M1 family aminopeptidase [Blastocatellia bacterium]MCX7751413.1 M1 family aminopeptidase [Blastocatellia bacterium]MDW8169126.1 M1 family aminopeptidase [Acidobacteriota bacterium]MDW8255987.1 M1 family aminopeptidase [Acidobacteriota bacterium]
MWTKSRIGGHPYARLRPESNSWQRVRRKLGIALLVFLGFAEVRLAFGQDSPVAPTGSPQPLPALDVVHYKVEADVNPTESSLTARSLITLRVGAATRSVVLELNGSLIVSRVQNVETNETLTFLQDRFDQLNVRVDLGKTVEAGTQLTLLFEYAGALRGPEGGPIPDRRLAYIGPEGGYLFYAARWLPFHEYAADRASYEITVRVPQGMILAGYSERPLQAQPVVERPTPAPPRGARRPAEPAEAPSPRTPRVAYTLVSAQPVLAGSFAFSKYITKEVRTPGGFTIELFMKPGDEGRMESLADPIGRMLEVYQSRFGPYAFGDRLRVVEIDDESLEYYVGPGTLFLAPRVLTGDRTLDVGRLAREVAFQWWGQAVAVRNFDDAWISQGLAQYSALLFREFAGSRAEYEQAVREVLERALAFESATSIARAPRELYDLSPSYRAIVYDKGAFVFRMLRAVLGDEKFFALLKTFYQTYAGKNASIADFEELAGRVAGRSLRSFFGLWVDSTGVPEFRVEYTILRTRDGRFKARGTVKQTLELFDMPVDLLLRAEGDRTERITIPMKGTEASFEIPSETLPREIVVDPDFQILHLTDAVRIAVVVRRGIEHLKNREYPEAEQQFRAALELDALSSWAHYNLGLLYFEQRNFQRALDAFTDALNGDKRPPWIVVWSHIYRGNCYDALGERERAVAEYQKALETKDDYNGAQDLARHYLNHPYAPARTRASR